MTAMAILAGIPTVAGIVESTNGFLYPLLSWMGDTGYQAFFLAILALAVFQLCALYAIFAGLTERKLIARVHSRIGPMYTGPGGILQTAADALKFIKKEVIYPEGSDRALFVMAPAIMLIPPLLATVFIPWGTYTIIESPYSLLIVLALLSLSPIAVLVGGWASNNKYSTIGGLRSAAMTMAYEVLLAVAIASVILTTGSVSIAGIAAWQETHGIWLAFLQPVAFLLFMIAAVASVERNPFDLTEAESEIVSGWKTEYGAVWFSLTLLAEYAKLLVVCIFTAAVFLGGWTGALGEIGLLIKVAILTMFMIVIRATAIRLRVDQLLRTLWTKLVPLAFLNFIVTLSILLLRGGG